MLWPEKTIVVGVGISRTNYDGVVEGCRSWLDGYRYGAAESAYICVTSVHGIVSAVLDHRIRIVLNRACIATSDGMPVVWAMRSFGVRTQQRVYGPTLMLKLCQMAQSDGRSIFLYGGKPVVLEELRRSLEERFPRLQIAGVYSPPFGPLSSRERDHVRMRIRRSQASIVFVGLSTPKQELWMSENAEALKGRVLVGVGAAFDFHARVLKQAPTWMQNCGLEWLFRLLMEPRRLWKRYLLVTPIFLPLWMLQRLGVLRYQVADSRGGPVDRVSPGGILQ
jgi:N-acetylglucosaminyldiphosphoundecaprenol N-acetyl-beta-D-mannosaminyltransferase